MKVKIVAAKAHKQEAESAYVKQYIEAAQQYVDENDFTYIDDTVNMVYVVGNYHKVEHAMNTTLILVNTTKQVITGIKCKIELSFQAESADIAVVNGNFDESFLGELNPGEGVLLQMNIPVRGLDSDHQYLSSAISGKLDDIVLNYKNQ